MLHRALIVLTLAPALFLAACRSAAHSTPGPAADAQTTARNHGYALLYSTISEECDIDKVLILKSPAPPVARLIKSIGQFSRDAKSTLETLAREEPAIALDHQGLPEVEAATRRAIAGATSNQILFHGGKDLEFRLLLTQHEALNYITHLAASLADHDPRDNRRLALGQLSKRAQTLHTQVLALLKAPYVQEAN
ncbi:MAG TPA: hypothetical protein PKE29_17305 [Phycisphaerales bacterium]|nr:hypothetical protein [Phycisphaerales bacterium]